MGIDINEVGAVQTSVRTRRKRGKPGQLAHTGFPRNLIDTFINAEPQSRFTRAITVSTYTDAATYRFTIGDTVVSYVALTADVNVAGVAGKLKAAIESNPVAGGYVTVSLVGAVLTLTGRWPGFDIQMSTTDAKLSLAAASNALLASAVAFGRVLFRGGQAASEGNRLARVANAASLSLASHVLTPVVLNSTPYPITLVSPSGATYAPSYTSTGSATAALITAGAKAAIDSVAPFVAAGGSTTASATILTVSLPAGWSLQASAALFGNARNAGVNADVAMVGVALFTQAACGDVFPGGEPTDGYAPNSAMDVLTHNGAVWVESTQTILMNDPVFIELAGDDAGRVYNTTSATRVLSRRLRWYEGSDGADGIAMVEVLNVALAAG